MQMPEHWTESPYCEYANDSLDDWQIYPKHQQNLSEEDSSDLDDEYHTGTMKGLEVFPSPPLLSSPLPSLPSFENSLPQLTPLSALKAFLVCLLSLPWL